MRVPEWLARLDVPELKVPELGVPGLDLTQRERRTVAVGAALAVAIVLFWLFTRPPAPVPAGAEDSRRELHARLRALAGQREQVDRAWERARRRQAEMRDRLLPERDAGRAGVALSRLVEELAERGRVELERTSVGEARPLGGGLSAVPVDVDVAAGVHGLRDFLRELERAGPTLTAGNLRITSGVGTSLAGPTGEGAPLRVQLTVVGYTLSADSALAADRGPGAGAVGGTAEGTAEGTAKGTPSAAGAGPETGP